MTLALWVVGAYVVIVYFGTLALQLLLWLVQVLWTVLVSTATLAAGIAGTLWLAMFDRAELRRIWREDGARTRVVRTLARERWG